MGTPTKTKFLKTSILLVSGADPPIPRFFFIHIDGACKDNGNAGSTAGVGVWFGKNNPLNVSQLATGRQTNNSAEIEAATIAATKANEAGHKYLKIFTDSQFLIDSMTKWLPRWKENDRRTSANKPVLNRVEFEKLEEALSPPDVVFEHVPSHQGIEGNEEADKLAVQAIENQQRIPPDTETQNYDQNISFEVIEIPRNITSSEESTHESDITENEDEIMRREVEQLVKKFNESMAEKESTNQNITNRTLAWDHE
ncbi:ribonuclease H1-like [Leptopilina boulardi]|uniref:ribonuclease H1-like n=1 Tax=Leptopilina boulardi TaxID=63433 RepID=UPI0021F5355E|nr:ribonuclease H1-like [Leptopilina boulardi]